MRILITGSNGQVGFCLVKLLEKKKWDFLALDKSQLDITNLQAVEQIILAYKPDVVINAAAYTAVDKAESDLENVYKINSDGVRNLAVASNKISAAIFHISTDYVFSGEAPEPYVEDDIIAPLGAYGLSKLKGEQEAISNNPKHIILRTAWVFGEHGNNFVKTMIRLGRDREQLNIVGDQFGGPTYAGDISSALLKIAQQYEQSKNLSWGVYHFSGHPYVSWFEFAESIFSEVDQQGIYNKHIPLLKAITTADYPTPARRPSNSRLNCSKIQENFNINMSDWKKALKNIRTYS
jgi:dTDP-4-dehydrorhamnose reductase